MTPYPSRAPRRPLARTRALALVLAAVAAAATLGACVDDAPTATGPAAPDPTSMLAAGAVLTVGNTSGGTEVGSLRWAVAQSTGGEIIRFDPALAGSTIVLDTTLVIRNAVTIEGPADRGITISGGGRHEVVYMAAPALSVTTFRNVSLTGGLSTRSYNPAGAIGEGTAAAGHVVLENSAVWGNRADSGMAIRLYRVTLVNSTVSGNITRPTFPAVFGGTFLHVTNSTIAHNSGGGVGGGTLVLRNSILAARGGKNCLDAPDTLAGANLADDISCGDAGVVIVADAKLEDLRDNGGPSMTHGWPLSAPALNRGIGCTVTEDQRHSPRDEPCDLGAFERTDLTRVTLTIDPSAAVNATTGWAVVTGTVHCSRPDALGLAVRLGQEQKTRGGTRTVDAAATIPIDCTTSPRPWSASMALTSGAFQSGDAAAAVETANAPQWVTPASAAGTVKLYRARR